MKLSIELPTDVQATLLRLAVTEFRATDKQAAYLLTQLLRKGQPGAGEALLRYVDLERQQQGEVPSAEEALLARLTEAHAEADRARAATGLPLDPEAPTTNPPAPKS